MSERLHVRELAVAAVRGGQTLHRQT
jgi:hypothetical protein